MTDTPSPIREHGDVERLYDALASAQAEFEPIKKQKTATVKPKDGTKQSYTYRYAELVDVNDATRPALSRHGLSVIQPTCMQGQALMVVTRLAHRSGAWIESDYPVISIGGGFQHQQAGGAVTYARRYALCAILNVSGEDDIDDGDHDEVDDRAQWHNQPAPAQPPRRAAQPAGGGNLNPPPASSSNPGAAPSSNGGTTPTTEKTTSPPKKTVIDQNDPIIIDLKGHLRSWDELRHWHEANKDKIVAKGEEWKNEFYSRYDDHAARLKKEAGLTTT